jgi:hypothetical protein
MTRRPTTAPGRPAGRRDGRHGAQRASRRTLQLTLSSRPVLDARGAAMRRGWWFGQLAMALVWGLCSAAQAQAQAKNAVDPRAAFRACDAHAFLALGIARNYLMSDRNRSLVMPQVEGSPMGRAMAEELFDRVESGQIKHPGQFAADTLFKCAGEMKLRVGATREHAAVCFTRTDVAFLLHTERGKGSEKQKAVSNVSAKLTARNLYPMSLISQVSDAVYTPPQLPDLQHLMGAVAWGCINQRPGAASAASR